MTLSAQKPDTLQYFPSLFILSGVRLSLLVLRPLTGLLYQPRMIGDGDCGEIGGMKIGRGHRRPRFKEEQWWKCFGRAEINKLETTHSGSSFRIDRLMKWKRLKQPSRLEMERMRNDFWVSSIVPYCCTLCPTVVLLYFVPYCCTLCPIVVLLPPG
jgi:hypothetical protein